MLPLLFVHGGDPRRASGVAEVLQPGRFEFLRMAAPMAAIPWCALTGRAWSPSVDIMETSESYVVELKIPGFSADQVWISLTGKALTIEGERDGDREEDRQRRSFKRVFVFPKPVTRKVLIEFGRGVLTVTLTKAGPSAVPRGASWHARRKS